VRRKSWGATPSRPHFEHPAVTTPQMTLGLKDYSRSGSFKMVLGECLDRQSKRSCKAIEPQHLNFEPAEVSATGSLGFSRAIIAPVNFLANHSEIRTRCLKRIGLP
jgi:hypothetical protein